MLEVIATNERRAVVETPDGEARLKLQQPNLAAKLSNQTGPPHSAQQLNDDSCPISKEAVRIPRRQMPGTRDPSLRFVEIARISLRHPAEVPGERQTGIEGQGTLMQRQGLV